MDGMTAPVSGQQPNRGGPNTHYDGQGDADVGPRSRSASIGREDAGPDGFAAAGPGQGHAEQGQEQREGNGGGGQHLVHPKAHTHRLVIRQQPLHSRMCGFGEKVDRRPVDPPPIIQLEITSSGSPDDVLVFSLVVFNFHDNSDNPPISNL
ncbi:hypothetical protein BJ741DRAFT_593781 [Chytriomyces cf. hyalinus JEL632]|nr:hypothetical protein BJ741DRAFT_593781 [Chytriomyces cf. hyalinus JEL632]